MRGCAAAALLLLLWLSPALVRGDKPLPWDQLSLRCASSSSSSSSSSNDSVCATAQQSFQECDLLFGGSGGDAVLLRACRAAAWAESENRALERMGTGTISARWSSTPMGDFWFASASRADDTGLSATFEETLFVNSACCNAKT
jgi:hypothetical protein